MPEINNSSQFESLTATSDGVNVMPTIQATSHFFAEGNGYSQVVGKAFGPLSETQFRVTSAVTVSSQIYTICQGQVFVQPQSSNASKVNVILRPFKQPHQGISIKYFIYRGLNKTDFIEGTNVAAKGTNQFIDFIWAEFDKFYEDDTDPIPAFKGSFIGYPENIPNQPATDLIDKYLFKVNEVDPANGEEDPNFAFELPMIPRGISMGTVTGEVGIDIVLNSGDYSLENDVNPLKLNLGFARLADGVLDTANESTDFKKKLLKEATVRFMDIVAFYGSHANGSGKLFFDTSTTPLTTKEDIYGKLNAFPTKNRCYINIQSNRQRSYNFYNNYVYSDTDNTNMKIGISVDNLTLSTFGNLGWPVHIFENAQTGAEESGIICVRFLADNANLASTLFVQSGFLLSPHDRNFVSRENLLQTISEETPNVDPKYSKKIQFSIPKVGEEPIASIINVIYESRSLSALEHVSSSPPDPRSFDLKDIDDLFGPVNAVASNAQQNAQQLPVIVGNEEQIISFLSDTGVSTGVVRVKRVEDIIQTTNPVGTLRRYTYETIMNNISRDGSPFADNPSGAVEGSIGQAQQYIAEENNFYLPPSPYSISLGTFTDGLESILSLELKFNSEDSDVPTKKMLGITKQEHDLLGALVATHNLNNAKIYFDNLLGNDGSRYVSSEGIKYARYLLYVIAEDDDGQIKIYIPNEGIIVFSIDEFIFFSKNYSEPLFDLLSTNSQFNDILIPE